MSMPAKGNQMLPKPQPTQKILAQENPAGSIDITFANNAAEQFILDECQKFGMLTKYKSRSQRYLLDVLGIYEKEQVIAYINSYNDLPKKRNFTIRRVKSGLGDGAIICFSNEPAQPDPTHIKTHAWGERYINFSIVGPRKQTVLSELEQFGKVAHIISSNFSLYVNAVYNTQDVVEHLESYGKLNHTDVPLPSRNLVINNSLGNSISFCTSPEAESFLCHLATQFGNLSQCENGDHKLEVSENYTTNDVAIYLENCGEYMSKGNITVSIKSATDDGDVLGDIVIKWVKLGDNQNI